MRLEDVKLDAEIPAEQFTYDPPADAQEMKELKSGARPATAARSDRQEARPVVDGTAYDGKPISLAEPEGARGRAGLLGDLVRALRGSAAGHAEAA